jgi:hypothetical protein
VVANQKAIDMAKYWSNSIWQILIAEIQNTKEVTHNWSIYYIIVCIYL